jgi:cysteine protease ATG4
MSYFMDDPSPLCPFSVHRMALIGKELGKEVGEWFGPSTAQGALKTLANAFPPCGLAVAGATDGMVFKSDVYAASNLPSTGWEMGGDGAHDEASGRKARRLSRRAGQAVGESPPTWGSKAVLVLVGLRLGLDGVNPIYHESVKVRRAGGCLSRRS